jgi:hypothetical protein
MENFTCCYLDYYLRKRGATVHFHTPTRVTAAHDGIRVTFYYCKNGFDYALGNVDFAEKNDLTRYSTIQDGVNALALPGKGAS